MAPTSSRRQLVLFAFLCFVWGSTWLAMKTGTATVPPGVFSGLRWTAAGAVLVLFRAARNQPVRFPPRLFGRVMVVAVLMISFNAVIMLYGLRHVGSGLASVITSALTPISLLGFAVMMGQERFNPRHLAALAVGIGGILLLFGPKALAGRLDALELLGVAGVIIGNLSYCLGSVLARPLMRTLEPAQMAGVTNLLGGILLLVLAIAFEPGAIQALHFQWPIGAWTGFWFLLLPGSLGATIIYFILVRDWGASRTGSYAFISPLIAVLLGTTLSTERLGPTDAAGMALMLAAAAIVLRKLGRRGALPLDPAREQCSLDPRFGCLRQGGGEVMSIDRLTPSLPKAPSHGVKGTMSPCGSRAEPWPFFLHGASRA
ncbi:MAG TPA: EamA family transporter [Phenylobacterium sp.]